MERGGLNGDTHTSSIYTMCPAQIARDSVQSRGFRARLSSLRCRIAGNYLGPGAVFPNQGCLHVLTCECWWCIELVLREIFHNYRDFIYLDERN